jgi:hypothetical protein
MGPTQRAWRYGGNGVLVEALFDRRTLVLVAGERPLLGPPPNDPAADWETAFGWAMAELVQQRCGWRELVRHVIVLAEIAAGILLVVRGRT